MTMKFLPLIVASCASFVLVGCATQQPPAAAAAFTLPEGWQAPLPHQGDVGSLAQWWQRQGDPVLVELIDAAQTVSPSIAQSLSRIETSRASRVASDAALGPRLDASLSASRGVTQPGVPLATTVQGGLQASWEVDLFGANRSASNAAQAQFEGSQAQWHDARVSIAAEVANLYYSLRTCHQLLAVTQADAQSRRETARLSDISAKAGFTAPAVAALARASAAESNSRVTQQQAQCDLDTKAMVALTAIPEPALRKKLASALARPAQAAPVSIANVPAQTVAQRPDVFVAEREVAAASAQVGAAQAQRYPRLSLSGSIGALRYNTGGVSTDLTTWSIGPVALSLPLFDGGQRAANVDAAKARYVEAAALYNSKVRQAVREVEEALVNLQSTDARRLDSETSTLGYNESLAATQARYTNGMASLVELEDARRTALAAQSAQVSLQLERNRAWVSLYRALGGGWTPDAPTLNTQ